MPRGRQRTNPFYVLLVAIGIAFTVTACAYFVMALRGSTASGPRSPAAAATDVQSPQALIEFLDHHGVKLLVAELALLALATCGAIGTDNWWSARDARDPGSEGRADDKTRHP